MKKETDDEIIDLKLECSIDGIDFYKKSEGEKDNKLQNMDWFSQGKDIK